MVGKRDLNAWLSYTIVPGHLTVTPRPAMWGNGQLEAMAQLHRPCVEELVCFGFGPVALKPQVGSGFEEHLVPAVYDVATGKKYFLNSAARSTYSPLEASVTFRPDRQIWHYEFDDLDVDVSLILPRLLPGHLFKLELSPEPRNETRDWHICQELRGPRATDLRATQAGCDYQGSTVWCRGSRGHWQALGATEDAQAIVLGEDRGREGEDLANDILVTTGVKGDQATGTATVYLARALGLTREDAMQGLERLLSSPEELEVETEEWWNRYLNEVPCLDVPDESFSKTFLWSWANFRMNRIDVPIGKAPAGLFNSNNLRLDDKVKMGFGDQAEAEVIQMLHDPEPARNLMLYVLSVTQKRGLVSDLYDGIERDRYYYIVLGWLCGLAQRYMLTTGDTGLLEEDIGGITLLERLENALEAHLEYENEATGLYRVSSEYSTGLSASLESVGRYRGAGDFYYSNCSAAMYGTFLALADIEALAGKRELSAECLQKAESLANAIREHMWNGELGFFSDLSPDGSVSDCMGIGGLLTGLAANHPHRPGGIATKEQASRLAEWCGHPDFVSEYGVTSLRRLSPYFDPSEFKGFNSGLDMHWCNQIPAGLYAHGCFEEAHRQLFKLFRRFGENGGLGPRYRGESYNPDTGEILPWRSPNYPCTLSAMSSVIEGVFGLRWDVDGLKVDVHAPWPRARLSNLRIRDHILDLELGPDGQLIAEIDGKEVTRGPHGSVELPWELLSTGKEI